MTNSVGDEENVVKHGDEGEQFTPQAWQEYVRRKIRTQTSWTVLEESRLENKEKAANSAKKNYKNLMKSCFLAENGDEEDLGNGKRSERGEEKLFFGGILRDLKKKSKKDLRVSFKERVHSISPDIRKPPRAQELKSGDDEHFRSKKRNIPRSKSNNQSRRKEIMTSSSVKAKNSELLSAFVDGTSMCKSGNTNMKGLERFLPQVSLDQCNDFDSAVIEVVREYNDPCRGVHGESIDLFF